MTENGRAVVPGSERSAVAEAGTPVPADTLLSVTLVLRRKTELPEDLVTGTRTITPAELATEFGASAEDVSLVSQDVVSAGCTVDAVDEGRRTMTVGGTAAALGTLFGTTLSDVESTSPGGDRVKHRQRTGNLSVPASLDGIVVAVLGLDDRPQSRGHFRLAAQANTSYTPLQLGEHYTFPAGDGTGITVAVIELGGGFAQDDLDAYWAELAITGGPKVTAVGVDGGSNVAGKDPNGADGEVLLDLEVIGALAPKASIVCYFAPNTDQGFADAISTAAHATPTPAAISISWGGPENTWTAQARTAMDAAFADAAALGITVTVAAGDNGSTDGQPSGQHVDYPAASPNVLACGGTRVEAGSETVWGGIANDGATGGGVSTLYAQPAWQKSAGIPSKHKLLDFLHLHASTGGRGVPDVAGDADPQTGWKVRVDGQDMVIGGTSAVAPMWAALVARLAQALGKPLGLLAPQLYAGIAAGKVQPGFVDVTSGTNGAYQAADGWDPCTGLGVPDGTALLAQLKK